MDRLRLRSLKQALTLSIKQWIILIQRVSLWSFFFLPVAHTLLNGVQRGYIADARWRETIPIPILVSEFEMRLAGTYQSMNNFNKEYSYKTALYNYKIECPICLHPPQ